MELFTNIAFLAVAQGIFLSLVLFFLPRGQQQANRYLALLILVFSLWTAEYAAYFTTHFYTYPHLLFSVDAFPLLFGPLLYFYARSLRGNPVLSRKWELLHFLPFVLHLLQQMPFFLEPAAVKIEALRALRNAHSPPDFSLTFFVMESLKFLHLLLYLGWLSRLVPQAFSSASLYRRWLNRLILGLGLFALFDLTHLLSLYFFEYDYLFDLSRLMLFSGALVIYYIGYATLRRPALLGEEGETSPSVIAASKSRYEKSALPPNRKNALRQQLLAHMEQAKPWLDPALTLSDLAEQLGLSKHHLSQLLNEDVGQNFYEFINTYRVRAAQHMLADAAFANYTILAIAYEAGFRNKASFNTAFKKHSGLTPSAFRKLEFRAK